MLSEGMKLWHGLVIAAVSLCLQAFLLAAINYLLSRYMANETERMLKKFQPQPQSRSSLAHHRPPAAQERKEAERGIPESEPHDRHDSDTSSGSSDSSPPTCQAIKHVTYTEVVFSDLGELENESSLDYENIMENTDYVNASPKIHKSNFWTSVNPSVSKPVEYTQVAM
ncbi:regulator of hemoglobinization and erythroid cell expansion protein isoform X1 [Erinaceus europaeus]|uniref:Regulator of hemoglobinization and erythroid cell expansion protein isoform X1 n=1 Tax=Erinaceus europaeus TaxID=9365 RepID=A0A1S2ZR19_ERIEU|nr:regulator of hemoglobinization and erythroid cell expansion protein isoform X1 [Erinaceus europaeus]XP_060034723.1 regulator of hemoglobinization and erythroid cell expansion protein isoform X1 [Erinaceus europaeus]XP_060034724.1 regulator of hemoglobinization and erythroid cell expansion protein isoform X1 [Erinaceus europaeus]